MIQYTPCKLNLSSIVREETLLNDIVYPYDTFCWLWSMRLFLLIFWFLILKPHDSVLRTDYSLLYIFRLFVGPGNAIVISFTFQMFGAFPLEVASYGTILNYLTILSKRPSPALIRGEGTYRTIGDTCPLSSLIQHLHWINTYNIICIRQVLEISRPL